LAAYSNSFGGPFVYDDIPAILENTTIRNLWDAFLPPPGTTTSGRPLVNLSLALNWAAGGAAVAGYHLLNLLIHLAAGLALFGVVRRTLAKLGQTSSVLPAAAAALLWTVHPLQTESVTYVVQRAESLMGLCYLLTIYCFIRSVDGPSGRSWCWLAWAACLGGMASKEVMVSAPLMVWLYDRTFVAGSFRAAWLARKRFYAALASTWLLLGICVASTGGNRGGTVGLDVGVQGWSYGLTQFRAAAHYLRLAVWPQPLVFEYGTFWESGWQAVLPSAALVLALLLGTVVALVRSPVLGFAGAWFFVMLAPTSLVPGTTQMIVEHRMYLSLAAVVVTAAVAAWLRIGSRSLWAAGGVAVLVRRPNLLSQPRLPQRTRALERYGGKASGQRAGALQLGNRACPVGAVARGGEPLRALARALAERGGDALQLRLGTCETRPGGGGVCSVRGGGTAEARPRRGAL
jgi:hypothetical protein